MPRPKKKSVDQGAFQTTTTTPSTTPSAALTPPVSPQATSAADVLPETRLFDPQALAEPNQLARRSTSDYSRMSVDELLAIRAEIDQRLPALTLADVDLEEELLLQYHSAKGLLARVMDNDGVPANQKSQVLNTCTSVLEQITRTQTALYNAERIKAMEMALERVFAGLAQPLREDFYHRYEASLRELASSKKDRKA